MKSTYDLDRHERRILQELQSDARVTHAEIGRRIGLSATAVSDRVRDMESAGVIRSYTAIIDPALVGLPIVGLVTMTCDGERCKRLAGEVEKFPEVVECHRLTGDASALLKVVVPSISALEALVDKLAAFGKPSTAIVLSSPFAARCLPISSAE